MCCVEVSAVVCLWNAAHDGAARDEVEGDVHNEVDTLCVLHANIYAR